MYKSPYTLNSEPLLVRLDAVIVEIIVNNTDNLPIVKVDPAGQRTLKDRVILELCLYIDSNMLIMMYFTINIKIESNRNNSLL